MWESDFLLLISAWSSLAVRLVITGCTGWVPWTSEKFQGISIPDNDTVRNTRQSLNQCHYHRAADPSTTSPAGPQNLHPPLCKPWYTDITVLRASKSNIKQCQ